MSMSAGQVRDSLSKDSTDTTHMSLQNDTVTGTHAHRHLPPIIVQRKFQATVEEYDSDTSSVVSPMEKCSSCPSRTSTASRAYSETHTPPSSRGCSPRHGHKPSVHFSTRHPVVLHHRTGSSSSSSREGSCREADSTTTTTTTTGGGHPFLSAVDKQWGILFSEHGEPTERLGQVLRGLANYMIREYEPRSSLVIPPGKLYAFYRRHRLEKEPFPLGAIFDLRSRHALRSLELLYQDLSCEYHLIQDHHRTRPRPSIPALTPEGLQTWLTSFIQASPDTESLRLSGILLDAPLDADTSLSPPGAKPERLPAQLPRYLLPARRNERAHRVLVAALHDWHRRMGIASEPPPHHHHHPLPGAHSYTMPPQEEEEEEEEALPPRARLGPPVVPARKHVSPKPPRDSPREEASPPTQAVLVSDNARDSPAPNTLPKRRSERPENQTEKARPAPALLLSRPAVPGTCPPSGDPARARVVAIRVPREMRWAERHVTDGKLLFGTRYETPPTRDPPRRRIARPRGRKAIVFFRAEAWAPRMMSSGGTEEG